MKKRILSLLLAALMCLSMIPGALASEELQPEPAAEAEEEVVEETAEPVEAAEPVEETEPAEKSEPIEEAAPAEESEPIEEAEPVEAAEPVETEPMEEAEPAGEEEPVLDGFVDTGIFGETTYRYEDGVITFSPAPGKEGSAHTADYFWAVYSLHLHLPWYSYRDKIKTIVIEPGIVYLGSVMFYGCAVEELYLPVTVGEIDYGAFNGCSNLKDVYYEGTEYWWNKIVIPLNAAPNYPETGGNEALIVYAKKHFGDRSPNRNWFC